jgi:iron-sulfur cluster repair protein YtfE (RIC family)
LKKATDSLLSDHKMIRKLLDGFHLENPRFPDISKTLQRVVASHAWFEDNVFLPAFKNEPLLVKIYLDELYEEHQHIDFFMALIRETQMSAASELDAYTRQLRAILENHLKKEEDALFPLAERILDSEGMNRLSAEMERRQKDVPT